MLDEVTTMDKGLSDIIKTVEDWYGVTLTGTGRRSVTVTRGRKAVVDLALRDGYKNIEIARALEIHHTSVSHLSSRQGLL